LIAIAASAACRLPTCLCASPCCERMKISQSGHSVVIVDLLGSLRRARCLLLCMRHRRLAHPRAVLPRFHARSQPLAVARAVALDHFVELGPVDRAEIVVLALGVPLEV